MLCQPPGERKGVGAMVTYGDLFNFVIMLCAVITLVVTLIIHKKECAPHIPAPKRGCVSNHFPLTRSAHPPGGFCCIGNEVSYTAKNKRPCSGKVRRLSL